MKEYKVLTQKDRWLGSKFNPEKLENAINAYAQEGWELKAMATAQFPGWGANREEMVIVMERSVK